jgi:hypothetical protein
MCLKFEIHAPINRRKAESIRLFDNEIQNLGNKPGQIKSHFQSCPVRPARQLHDSHALVCTLMTQSSSSIMLLIPRSQISLRDPHNLMRHSAIVILDNSLSILVPLPPGNQVNPAVVVDNTHRQPRQSVKSAAEASSTVGIARGNTYKPMPTTRYVPYQKLTSPPFAPPVGGYHGATSI